MIEAEVIRDSRSAEGKRLTTLRIRGHRFILAEFNTHRMFSRNASSSRAIPTLKLIEEVRSSVLRATPVYWGKNQKGMQADEELTGDDLDKAKDLWAKSANNAADMAQSMHDLGMHKQIVNRVIEPYLHFNVVVTSTEFQNFFGLRIHNAAQPEIRMLAEAILDAMSHSTPRRVEANPDVLSFTYQNWHLPYVDEETIQIATAMYNEEGKPIAEAHTLTLGETLIRVSVARCARVSYQSFETGNRSTIAEDLVLYQRLLGSQPVHASPAEHQATPDVKFEQRGIPKWMHSEMHGNLVGWIQYRKLIPGESCAPTL